MKIQRMTRIILAAGAVVVLASCFHEEMWSGWVYPDKANLLVDRPIGNYPSLEACRSAAKRMIAQEGWAADYECVYRTRFLGHKFVSCGGPE